MRKLNLKTLGAQLRIRRKNAGWGQSEVARKIGISQASLSKIEQGKAMPDLQIWIRLCDTFGLPFEDPPPVELNERR